MTPLKVKYSNFNGKYSCGRKWSYSSAELMARVCTEVPSFMKYLRYVSDSGTHEIYEIRFCDGFQLHHGIPVGFVK